MVDQLAYGGEGRGWLPSAPARPRRLPSVGTVVGVLSLVITILLVVGVLSAVRLAAGTQPESVLPAASFAVAKVDLDPPLGQKLKVRDLARHFPDAPAKDFAGLLDELGREAAEDADLDYARDVKPWLGKRIAIVGFRGAGGHPRSVAAIQHVDAGKARAALGKVRDAAFEIRGDYVVVAPDQESLAEARTLTNQQSLAQRGAYHDDVATLSGDQIAQAWVDNRALVDAMLSESGDDGRNPFSDALRDGSVGRTVLGLHAGDGYGELEAITLGGPAAPSARDAATLGRLPAAVLAAVHLDNPAAVAEGDLASIGLPASVLGSGFPLFLFGFVAGSGSVAFSDSAESVESCIRVSSDGTRQPCPSEITPPPVGRAISAILRQPVPDRSLDALGEALAPAFDPDRSGALLADLTGPTTFALGAIPKDEADGTALHVGLVSRGHHADARSHAEAAAARVRAAGFVAGAVESDGALYAAVGAGWLEQLRSGGHLNETPAFRRAMGDLTGEVTVAVYVDLDGLQRAIEEFPEELAPLRAIGMSVQRAGDRSTFRLRVTVD